MTVRESERLAVVEALLTDFKEDQKKHNEDITRKMEAWQKSMTNALKSQDERITKNTQLLSNVKVYLGIAVFIVGSFAGWAVDKITGKS
jgi:F0F1-type ATP synthase assembly protein I